MFTYKSQKKRDKILDNIYHQLLTCVTPIRPGRSFDRHKKHKSQKSPKNRRTQFNTFLKLTTLPLGEVIS